MSSNILGSDGSIDREVLQAALEEIQDGMSHEDDCAMRAFSASPCTCVRSVVCGLVAELQEAQAASSDDLDPRLKVLCGRIYNLLQDRTFEQMQYDIDDLIYDHVAAGKKASAINNNGVYAQAEALVEELGITETIAELERILQAHTSQGGEA